MKAIVGRLVEIRFKMLLRGSTDDDVYSALKQAVDKLKPIAFDLESAIASSAVVNLPPDKSEAIQVVEDLMGFKATDPGVWVRK